MSTILQHFKKSDTYQIKKYISKHKGLFDSYLSLHRLSTINESAFVSSFISIHKMDELNFIDICITINKYIDTFKPTVINTLQEIVFIAIRKYIWYGREIFYLKFIESLFEHIKAYTQELINTIFYTLLLDSSLRKFFFIYYIDVHILNIFLPRISVNTHIDILKYNPSTELEKILEFSLDKSYLYNIDITFLLFKSGLIDILPQLYNQKYNFTHPSCDINWEYEYIEKRYGLNHLDVHLTTIGDSYIDDIFVRNTFRRRFSNLLQLKQIENNINQAFDKTSFEEILKNTDLNVRLEHNVSPLLMCKNVEIAKIMSSFEVDKSNVNGLFYIHLEKDEQLFQYMMGLGVDPLPSIYRLQKNIKMTLEASSREKFESILTLLLGCYRRHKKPLSDILFKNTRFCLDLCKSIIEYL